MMRQKRKKPPSIYLRIMYPGVYEVFISQFVFQEIEQTTNEEKKKNLLDVIDRYPLRPLVIDDISTVDTLADLYVNKSIIPAKKRLDALHVACCVLNKIDYLVSWNYKHLANVNKEKQIISLNFTHNYIHPLRIIRPFELLDYGNRNENIKSTS